MKTQSNKRQKRIYQNKSDELSMKRE